MNPEELEQMLEQDKLKTVKQFEKWAKNVLLRNMRKYSSQKGIKRKLLQRFEKDNFMNHQSARSKRTMLASFKQNLYTFGLNENKQVVGCCLAKCLSQQIAIELKKIVDTLHQGNNQKYYIPTLSNARFRNIIYEYHWKYFQMEHPSEQIKTHSANPKTIDRFLLSDLKLESQLKIPTRVGQCKKQDKQPQHLQNISQSQLYQNVVQAITNIKLKRFQRPSFQFQPQQFEADLRLRQQLKQAKKHLRKPQSENKLKPKIIKWQSKGNFKQLEEQEKYCKMYQEKFVEYQVTIGGHMVAKKEQAKEAPKLKQLFRINSKKKLPETQQQKIKKPTKAERTMDKETDYKYLRKQSTINSQTKFDSNVASPVSQGLNSTFTLSQTQHEKMFNSMKTSILDSLVRQACIQRQQQVTEPQNSKSLPKAPKLSQAQKQRQITRLLFKKLQIHSRRS